MEWKIYVNSPKINVIPQLRQNRHSPLFIEDYADISEFFNKLKFVFSIIDIAPTEDYANIS